MQMTGFAVTVKLFPSVPRPQAGLVPVTLSTFKLDGPDGLYQPPHLCPVQTQPLRRPFGSEKQRQGVRISVISTRWRKAERFWYCTSGSVLQCDSGGPSHYWEKSRLLRTA